MKGIKQHDMRDCGAACLATICYFYGLKISLVKVREIAKVDKNGASLYGLAESAKQLGFQADALNGNYEELLEGIWNKEICFPFVSHVIVDHAFEHYIVIKNIGKDKIHVFDPAKGHMKLSIERFLEIWSGNILNVIPDKNFVPRNLNKGYYAKFLSIFLKEGKPFLIVIVLSLVMALISVFGASLYQLLIDDYVLQGGYSDTTNHILGVFQILAFNIDKLFLVVLSVYIFQALLHVLRGYLISKLAKKVDGHFMSLFFSTCTQTSNQLFYGQGYRRSNEQAVGYF